MPSADNTGYPVLIGESLLIHKKFIHRFSGATCSKFSERKYKNLLTDFLAREERFEREEAPWIEKFEFGSAKIAARACPWQ